MTDFEIVPPEAREWPAKVRLRRGTAPLAVALALESGETVFLPRNGQKQAPRFVQPGSYLNLRGYMTQHRLVMRDGVEGWVMWAEKR